jgi:hypothetical protein
LRTIAEDRCLAKSAPVTMIYGEPPKEGHLVRFFGAHCRAPSDRALPQPFRPEKPGPSPFGDNAHFSWASLDGVSSTLVFSDHSTGFCRGIVFRYQNGGSRAIGQCRLHVDTTESVARPLRLCFRADSYPSRWPRTAHGVQVVFRQDAPTIHTEKDPEGWGSRPVQGLVMFWFTSESSLLVVEHQ